MAYPVFIMFSLFLRFIKRPHGIVVVIIVALLGVYVYSYFNGSKSSNNDFIVVKRGDVRQEVSVTGRVKSAQNVDLAFEKSGRVVTLFIGVGARVEPGQSLVELASADILADLDRANADVRVAEARLAELVRGARMEDVGVTEIQVLNARVVQEDAKVNLANQIQDAYTQADDAIRNKVDQLFTNPRSSSPRLIFVSDFQLQTDLESGRAQLESIFVAWNAKVSSISSQEAKQNLQKIKSFLDKAALAVNTLGSSSNISQTILDAYKAAILSGRSNINNAVESISSADEKLRSADSAFMLAQQQLNLKKALATPEQIASQEAEVAKADANMRNVEAQLAKTVLHSPIKGIVTKQDAKVGQIVGANIIVVSLASASEFQIEANMPEADIAKIAISQDARITLDAYGSDIEFDAKVVKIDPAETIIDGVSTYKVTLQFLKNDTRVKSGMTANTSIAGDVRKGVLFVPQRTVISKDGNKFVSIVDDEFVKEIKVKTGLRGSDGSVEILEGLKEGDKVLTSPENT